MKFHSSETRSRMDSSEHSSSQMPFERTQMRCTGHSSSIEWQGFREFHFAIFSFVSVSGNQSARSLSLKSIIFCPVLGFLELTANSAGAAITENFREFRDFFRPARPLKKNSQHHVVDGSSFRNFKKPRNAIFITKIRYHERCRRNLRSCCARW